MRGAIRRAVTILPALSILFPVVNVWALTPEQVISLKNAGVSDQTIQLMIRQEQAAADGSLDDSPGRKEIRDKDGRAVIIYSTGRRAVNGQSKEEVQTERAWEILKGLIIDTRRPR